MLDAVQPSDPKRAYLAYIGRSPLTVSTSTHPLDLTPYLNDAATRLEVNPEFPAILSTTLNGTSSRAAQTLRRAGTEDIYSLSPIETPDTIPFTGESLRIVLPYLIRYDPDGIIGKSSSVQTLRRQIAQMAPNHFPVLITGESGTGKELAAHALHRYSNRAGPFIPVNVSTLTETLADSELFGHIKGAFTGAVSTRRGLFEQAHEGTLFLDEIEELSLPLQAKLLRVLQDGYVRPVGGEKSLPFHVRVIAATNRPLEKLVAEGKFRDDLYYRLGVLPLNVPPLRERTEDIPLIAAYLALTEGANLPRGPTLLDPEIVPSLQNYSWPGNVRELENTIKRALVISPEDLGVLRPQDIGELSHHAKEGSSPFQEAKAAWEREYLLTTLRAVDWNVSRAAIQTGIGRSHLCKKMKIFRIERPERN